jgi:anaerobic ribonucleoside-triphosphate reductase activating protein
MNDAKFINVAAVLENTSALGPGIRNAIWLQGCPFHCPGCISPNWIPDKRSAIVHPSALIDSLFKNSYVRGLTISGGEPFFQPNGLNSLVNEFRRLRPEGTIIVFTGYTLSKLLKMPKTNLVEETLSKIDLLVDGPYIKELNNNKGLRGSSNQNFHRFSDRFSGIDFEVLDRVNEIFFRDGYVQLSGVPDKSISGVFLNQFSTWKEQGNVRT